MTTSVTLVAALAAGLAGTALLLARALAARARLQRAVARLDAVNQISRVLLTERNRRGVLNLVAEAAARFVRADMGHVALLDP